MDTDDAAPQPQRKSLRPGAEAIPPAPETPYPGIVEAPVEDNQQWATQVLPAVPGDDGTAFGDDAPVTADPVRFRKPWYRKPWVRAVAGGGLLAVAGGVTWAIVAGGGGVEVIASPSASPTVSATATPTASPSAEPVSLLDDGIAEGDYPAAAPRAGDNYPEALLMEDWVWDKAGPGWAVFSLAPYDAMSGQAEPTVLYLASPEGVLFEVQRLPERYANAVLHSVLEDERKVRIAAYDTNNANYGGALVTLASGAVDHMAFTYGSGESGSESFVTASSSNAELWISRAPDWSRERFERWTPASGWTRASIESDVMTWNVVSSPNGELVLLEIASNALSSYSSARSGADGAPNLVVYSVASDTSTVVRPNYTASDGYCQAAGITNEGSITVVCYDDEWSTLSYFAASDGARLSDPGDALPLQLRLMASNPVEDAVSGITVGGTQGDAVAYVVSIDHDGEEVTLLKAGDDLGFRGIEWPVISDLGGGLSLVSGNNACAVVDRENGLAALLGEVQGDATFGCVPWGVGNGATSANSGGWGGG